MYCLTEIVPLFWFQHVLDIKIFLTPIQLRIENGLRGLLKNLYYYTLDFNQNKQGLKKTLYNRTKQYKIKISDRYIESSKGQKQIKATETKK